MAKKKARKTKKTVRLPKRVKITREAWLEHLIDVSKRAITGQGNSIDEFFGQQAQRLSEALLELREESKNA